MEARPRWLQTDEDEDVAGSIRHAVRCLSDIERDPQNWKWALLAMHSALQGALVCHLVTTAVPVGAVTEQNARDWLEYFEQRRNDPTAIRPKVKLDYFDSLLKRARKEGGCGGGPGCPRIFISNSELSWLVRIHDDVRNQFAHFSPRGWSLEISGIPQLAILIARILSEIREAGWAFRHRDCSWLTSLDGALAEMTKIASSLIFTTADS